MVIVCSSSRSWSLGSHNRSEGGSGEIIRRASPRRYTGTKRSLSTPTLRHTMEYTFNEVKHIHQLGDKPLMGTTTLIHEVLPPNLTWWAAGMALKGMGWENKKLVKTEDRIATVTAWLETNRDKFTDPVLWEEHLQLCYKAHDENKKEAGAGGTEIHEAIEVAINEAITNNKGLLYESAYDNEAVERFAQWGRGKRFIYSEVNVYSEALWLGGVIDIVYEEEGLYYIGDIKTSKAIYPSQFIQEGLYDLQQSENGFFTAEGKKVGEPITISGYTIINIPRINADLNVKTYRDTEAMKNLGTNLVETYKTLQILKNIC